ncbi:hypothetical protein EDD37DRAFT_653182 [Exophiala viscosa]|uniref:Uncharacterized protein n=1 Tax=Exophiala viscosa TaxID=2486360 RepID=A0AAN6I9P5_9EURO|nr:hypothetical protein EDD36DRAFT_468708 [Exophiala viscosa]KAI1620867.1 hypothetical protein EDD37DRAFT_653182 [Exophiala viscosa]
MESMSTRVPWLPDEILLNIIAHTITPTTIAPDVILSSGLASGDPKSQTFETFRTPKLQCTVTNLKRTCRQFRAMVNQLLHRTDSTTVVLVRGPVPVRNDDTPQSMEVAEQYKATLEEALAHASNDNQPHNVIVHFQPELTAVYAGSHWFWEKCFLINPCFRVTDIDTVCSAQEVHYAAAVMLAAIMNVIVGRRPGVRIRLVFHEQDGTSLYKECPMMEISSPVSRRVLPFWEVRAIDVILDHWRWLREDDEGADETNDKENDKDATARRDSSIHQYITFPQMAYAKPYFHEKLVRQHWSKKLQKAWLTEDKGPLPLTLQAPYTGRPNEWWSPRDDLDDWYHSWLTMPESEDGRRSNASDLRCFLIEIVELGGLEETKIEVMELQRPIGTTTLQWAISNIDYKHIRRQPPRRSLRLINRAKKMQ